MRMRDVLIWGVQAGGKNSLLQRCAATAAKDAVEGLPAANSLSVRVVFDSEQDLAPIHGSVIHQIPYWTIGTLISQGNRTSLSRAVSNEPLSFFVYSIPPKNPSCLTVPIHLIHNPS